MRTAWHPWHDPSQLGRTRWSPELRAARTVLTNISLHPPGAQFAGNGGKVKLSKARQTPPSQVETRSELTGNFPAGWRLGCARTVNTQVHAGCGNLNFPSLLSVPSQWTSGQLAAVGQHLEPSGTSGPVLPSAGISWGQSSQVDPWGPWDASTRRNEVSASLLREMAIGTNHKRNW